ncbi:hypothetical protein CRG98_031362 [Punica granatum]|uniref:Uncharacterized protein n=1 Tax=Punica granatum TaxID=22663 RepID=A0A2I0IW68_PUNGR|nr:hypothetical protein CRG98_031362 [Punica granatum]
MDVRCMRGVGDVAVGVARLGWAATGEGPVSGQPWQSRENGLARELRARHGARSCTVDRPSDRDHLFTREGEGCEEPFERDGTTLRSRGRKWHAWLARCAAREISGPECSHGWNTMMESSNGESKPGNGLRGWRMCRLGSLVIFGLSRVGGYRNTGWFSGGFGRLRPWQGVDGSEGMG